MKLLDVIISSGGIDLTSDYWSNILPTVLYTYISDQVTERPP